MTFRNCRCSFHEAEKEKCWISSYMKKREKFGKFHKLINELDDFKFKNYFRVTREQFYELHELIAVDIQKQNTNFRRAIGTEERLAICLR
ncbi:hypothetical protein NQ314_011747 [Rhamnusium bicolor]|uniref:Uncharacterized protein n=1 Tax=Rhamnusium bicolor TaxID=1586634 RepID=A0AAV8XG05_9CUCU|nr:hypothetical protein NQ314_011747 [Rhamnusium bicolor]